MIGLIVGLVVGVAALLGVAAVWAADWIVGRLATARSATGAGGERLELCMEALCLGAGLPVPNLLVIHDAAPAALAFGRGLRPGTAAVTTGLLDSATSAELEAVLAHLLCRIQAGTARRDTWLALLGLLGPPGQALAARFRDASRVVAADIAGARLTRFPPGAVTALELMSEGAGGLRRRPRALRHLWVHHALGPAGHTIGLADRVTVLNDL